MGWLAERFLDAAWRQSAKVVCTSVAVSLLTRCDIVHVSLWIDTGNTRVVLQCWRL